MLKRLILIPVSIVVLTAADCNGRNQKNYNSVYDFTNRGEEWTYNNTQALIQDNLALRKELKDIKNLIEVKCK